MDLSTVEARVIGSLAEKQLTTPQQYPLTINALIHACNQSSNRDPVVAYDEGTIEPALSSLREAGLLRLVHPSHGRSAIRYRQVLDERFGLDPRSLSILTVLLLRGPQTIGELRARTERMADFDGLEGIQAELGRMADGDDPLVGRLPRRPGQKEERWAETLSRIARTSGTSYESESSVSSESKSVPGLALYLVYSDVGRLLDWLSRTLDFVETGRVSNAQGDVMNGEMLAGQTVLLLEHGDVAGDAYPPGTRWTGVWVEDPDAWYERLRSRGVEASEPRDEPWGVRLVRVVDPEGHVWALIQRR